MGGTDKTILTMTWAIIWGCLLGGWPYIFSYGESIDAIGPISALEKCLGHEAAGFFYSRPSESSHPHQHSANSHSNTSHNPDQDFQKILSKTAEDTRSRLGEKNNRDHDNSDNDNAHSNHSESHPELEKRDGLVYSNEGAFDGLEDAESAHYKQELAGGEAARKTVEKLNRTLNRPHYDSKENKSQNTRDDKVDKVDTTNTMATDHSAHTANVSKVESENTPAAQPSTQTVPFGELIGLKKRGVLDSKFSQDSQNSQSPQNSQEAKPSMPEQPKVPFLDLTRRRTQPPNLP